MSIEKELTRLKSKNETVLTIGVFDGVHAGHKYLLSKLVKQSRYANISNGVITFKQHPHSLLNPQLNPPYLTNLRQKTKLLMDEGVQTTIALTFTRELAQIDARQFIGFLKKYLNMCILVLGPDFALGRNREGNVDMLHNLATNMGFKLMVVPHLKYYGEIVSSTAIRNALIVGNIIKVNQMLGRLFSLEGHIISGNRRGTNLGFPTANLDIETDQLLPLDGVYATWAHIGNKRYPSVTNIGKRPTFMEDERIVEVCIIGLNDNLYGHLLKIDLGGRIRDEQKFATTSMLQNQIADDIKKAKDLLTQLNSKQSKGV